MRTKEKKKKKTFKISYARIETGGGTHHQASAPTLPYLTKEVDQEEEEEKKKKQEKEETASMWGQAPRPTKPINSKQP